MTTVAIARFEDNGRLKFGFSKSGDASASAREPKCPEDWKAVIDTANAMLRAAGA